uniref:CHK domain-containing protein n=1 Tax=Panagrellus redivivus TaxID=6233 RepID=A0A7E4UYT7_PANRE
MDTTLVLDDVPFAIGFVLDHLRKREPTYADALPENLVAFTAKDITGGKAYFSRIIRIAFTWNSSSITPESIILKVPGVQTYALTGDAETDAATDEYLEYAHSNENDVYKYLWNAAEKFNTTLKIPKIYFASGYSKSHTEGVIIMDDLSVTGTTLKLIPGFNNGQVESSIDELAKIHALVWKNGGVTVFDGCPGQDEFVQEMKRTANALRTISPNSVGLLMDEIDGLFTPTVYHYAVYSTNKFGFPPTLVHSDLWSANMLFKNNTNGTPTDDLLSIIDWQSGHAGNPFADIGRLLAVNTSAVYRRRETNRLLKRYYDVVSAEMDGKPPFTEEQMHYAYAAGMGYVAQFLGFGVPVYYNMSAIVGTDENKGKLQEELLDRTKCFFEDTLQAFKEYSIEK